MTEAKGLKRVDSTSSTSHQTLAPSPLHDRGKRPEEGRFNFKHQPANFAPSPRHDRDKGPNEVRFYFKQQPTILWSLALGITEAKGLIKDFSRDRVSALVGSLKRFSYSVLYTSLYICFQEEGGVGRWDIVQNSVRTPQRGKSTSIVAFIEANPDTQFCEPQGDDEWAVPINDDEYHTLSGDDHETAYEDFSLKPDSGWCLQGKIAGY
ncbi:hypothetical protein NE237_010634 [Protea cynaroides]|uniref:Uncharacterized protein n=1 Tax=Protea cynaroides TaxID=273540 RepID=A0A9Q0L0R3_9MAGN|nr:hypothetical protein NE237_010634 [Protea cynaroides]